MRKHMAGWRLRLRESAQQQRGNTQYAFSSEIDGMLLNEDRAN